MIKINLSPVRSDTKTELTVVGTVITLNNEEFDLSLLADGATATHEKLGAVTRIGNDYELTVIMTHGRNAPLATRYPPALEITNKV